MQMNLKRLSWLLVLPLLFTPLALADSSQPLTLTITGAINSSGTQHYVVNQDGGFLYASLFGSNLEPSSSQIHYSLVADVRGLLVDGHAEIHVTGMTTDGTKVKFDGKVAISDMIPAEPFPVSCASTACSSAIPSSFLGLVAGTLKSGGSTLKVSMPISLESPFLNPFGSPIVLAAADSSDSIVIVTHYDVARVQYSGVQSISYSVSGTLGTSPVSGGSAVLNTRANEDLFAGTESESGTITFADMTPSQLDASGQYSGTSIIPVAPLFDCTAGLPLLMGMPSLDVSLLPPALCTLTGFISTGSFTMVGSHVHIKGSYTTVWDIPAVTFGVVIPPPVGGTLVTASVSSS